MQHVKYILLHSYHLVFVVHDNYIAFNAVSLSVCHDTDIRIWKYQALPVISCPKFHCLHCCFSKSMLAIGKLAYFCIKIIGLLKTLI